MHTNRDSTVYGYNSVISGKVLSGSYVLGILSSRYQFCYIATCIRRSKQTLRGLVDKNPYLLKSKGNGNVSFISKQLHKKRP